MNEKFKEMYPSTYKAVEPMVGVAPELFEFSVEHDSKSFDQPSEVDRGISLESIRSSDKSCVVVDEAIIIERLKEAKLNGVMPIYGPAERTLALTYYQPMTIQRHGGAGHSNVKAR